MRVSEDRWTFLKAFMFSNVFKRVLTALGSLSSGEQLRRAPTKFAEVLQTSYMPKDMLWSKLSRVLLSWGDKGFPLQRGLNPELPHPRTEYCWVQAEGEECSGCQHISPFLLNMCHCVTRKISFTEPENKKDSRFDCNLLLLAKLAKEWEMSKSLCTSCYTITG